ncbi:hypothetical protein MRX96_027717 [Rhipicephalus microplus]
MVLSEEAPRPLVKGRAQLPPTGPPSPDSTPRLTREANNNTPVSHHHHHNHNEISRTDFKMRPPPAPKSAIHKTTKAVDAREMSSRGPSQVASTDAVDLSSTADHRCDGARVTADGRQRAAEDLGFLLQALLAE